MRFLSICAFALVLGLGGCSHISAMMGGDRQEETASSTMEAPVSAASATSADCAEQAQASAQPSGQAAGSADCAPAAAEQAQPAPQPQ